MTETIGLLFFIQGADKSALVDPSDEGWIDDKIRVGLFCLRVMNGNHIERTGNHLHGRRWHCFHCRDGVLIGVPHLIREHEKLGRTLTEEETVSLLRSLGFEINDTPGES